MPENQPQLTGNATGMAPQGAPEKIVTTPLDGIADGVLDDARFVHSVKHFEGGADTLALVGSGEGSEQGSSVTILREPEGDGTRVGVKSEQGSEEYISDAGQVFKVEHSGGYLSRQDILAHPDRAEANPDELTALSERLANPDLVVDRRWLGLSYPSYGKVAVGRR